MPASKGLGPLFIIPCQATQARCPGMTTLYHPALGQPYKAVLGFGQLDDCQLPMMGLGRLRRLRPRVPLVNVGELDRVAGHFWHFPANVWTWLRSCSLAAVTGNAKRWPRVSTAMCTCEPRRRLAPS